MTAGETRPDGAPPANWTFPVKYISVTTYRRDGTDVATPVWFVQDGDRLLIRTGVDSGKAKRIRRNPAVLVAALAFVALFAWQLHQHSQQVENLAQAAIHATPTAGAAPTSAARTGTVTPARWPGSCRP